jgi:hypothetical protein
MQAKRAVTAGSGLVVVRFWIVGDLEEVLAILPRHAQLIVGSLIADEGNKSAARVGGVVEDGGNRSGQAVVGARPGNAGIPRGGRGVIAEREFRFAGVKVAAGDPEFSISISFKPISGQNVRASCRESV